MINLFYFFKLLLCLVVVVEGLVVSGNNNKIFHGIILIFNLRSLSWFGVPPLVRPRHLQNVCCLILAWLSCSIGCEIFTWITASVVLVLRGKSLDCQSTLAYTILSQLCKSGIISNQCAPTFASILSFCVYTEHFVQWVDILSPLKSRLFVWWYSKLY